jgi:hypothetical protein
MAEDFVDNLRCPLVDCSQLAEIRGSTHGDDIYEVDCRRCGKFLIARTLPITLEFSTGEHYMVGLRQYILAENARDSRPVLNTNWQGLAQENMPKVALEPNVPESAAIDQKPDVARGDETAVTRTE